MSIPPIDTPIQNPDFKIVLRPHRSFSLHGINAVVGLAAGLWMVMGLAFATMGAWPVTAFLGFDLLLLYGALIIHHRDGLTIEVLELTDNRFRVSRINRWGQQRHWNFQPQWLQVIGPEDLNGQDRLVVRSKGEAVIIGAFLAPEERRRVTRELRQALARLMQPMMPEPATADATAS